MPAPQSSRRGRWRKAVLAYLAAHPDRPVKTRALARELDIPNDDYTDFRHLIREMLDSHALVLGNGRTLRLPDPTSLAVGTFRANPRGFGFVERPGQQDLYIHRNRTGGALEGDTVRVRLMKQRPHMPGPRGEVTAIVERATQRWVGILEKHGRNWFVQPQSRDPWPPLRVTISSDVDARAGQLVVLEPDEHSLRGPTPSGVVLEVLGDPDDAHARVRGILRRFGYEEDFSAELEAAARQAVEEIDPETEPDREDLRELTMVTIDPADARDFDDAISVESLGQGTYRLGVHIADVARYVPADSPLDLEAQQRGNSVYLPRHVVPMLPHALSSGACSLRPQETRLARSVFIDYDKQSKVLRRRFTNSRIWSHARLTYEQVTAFLEGDSAELDSATRGLLRRANTLAKRIRKRRIKQGMVTLSLPEVDIKIGKNGRVTDSRPADTSFSHTIIEMFMVEANEAVSAALSSAGLEHLRRVHPHPEPDAAKSLAPLTPLLGHNPPRVLDRASIKELLGAVTGQPEEYAVHYLLLRALPQAAYEPSRAGHFALASKDYCHFTSPIRRYPDLQVHRLFDHLADAPAQGDVEILTDEELAQLGLACSRTERRALQAERHAQRLLLVQLMRKHVGKSFDGLIVGVTQRGAFVQIRPFLAEGLLGLEDFGDDYWDYDRDTGIFVGRSSRRIIHIGQTLRVQIASVNDIREEIDLVPAERGPIGRPWAALPAATRKDRRGKPGRRSAPTSRGRGRKGGPRKTLRKKRWR